MSTGYLDLVTFDLFYLSPSSARVGYVGIRIIFQVNTMPMQWPILAVKGSNFLRQKAQERFVEKTACAQKMDTLQHVCQWRATPLTEFDWPLS